MVIGDFNRMVAEPELISAGSNRITSPALETLIASLKEPFPVSWVFFTVIVEALAQ